MEQTYLNHGSGGMASAFQLMEIAHTHYWTRDPSDPKSCQDFSTPGSNTAQTSQRTSPLGSRENLGSPISQRTNLLHVDGDRSLTNSPEARSPSARICQSDASTPEPDSDILRELLDRKRSLMMFAGESQVSFFPSGVFTDGMFNRFRKSNCGGRLRVNFV